MAESLCRAAAAALLCLMTAMAGAAGLDETARVIGGVSLGDARSDYAKEVSAVWTAYQRRIGQPMRLWACKELPRQDGGTVFYPFSGPDLPAIVQLFPDASRYVLIATQRGEPPPLLEMLSRAELEEYLAAFRKAWKFYGTLGFFRTEDLNAEGKGASRPIGVTGALMAFAVRLGFDIEAVEPIQIDVEGHQTILGEQEWEAPHAWDSVRLTLRKEGRPVYVDYVLMNLSDESLGRIPGLTRWLSRVAAAPTLLKAASHHPQEAGFSIFRDLVLEKAPVVVQDETGIDYAALAEQFEVRLYGRFTRPNAVFDQNFQRSLAEAYRKSRGVRPLGFRVGYEKDSGAALQVAVRADGPERGARSCR